MSLEIKAPIIDEYGKALTPSGVDSMLREIAQTLLGEIRERIHEEGRKADGSQIGTYSPKYLKRRIRNGKTGNTRIILSYTRQMQNDWKVIPLSGSYGLGFSNAEDADKAGWMQDRFGKIYGLTKEETDTMNVIIREWLKKNI